MIEGEPDRGHGSSSRRKCYRSHCVVELRLEGINAHFRNGSFMYLVLLQLDHVSVPHLPEQPARLG